ncbi:MAG: hypothetical protein NT062_14945, partial [Proteobacteria bacterium]|nr:hypothetical protein [Pseudomonadota bacterium]
MPRHSLNLVPLSVLVAATLTAGLTSSAAADPTADATAKLATLPGFRLLAGMSVTADGPGFAVTGIPDMSAAVWSGRSGWHGAIVMAKPGGFKFDGLDALGTITTRHVILVVSEETDDLDASKLPTGFASAVSPFLVGNHLRLAKGVNLLIDGAPGQAGVLGVLARGIGMTSGDVLVRGTAGEDQLARLIPSSKAGAASGPLSLAISLPPIVPMPFQALSADERSKVDLSLTGTTLTVAKVDRNVQFGGSLVANVSVVGQPATITANLTITP